MAPPPPTQTKFPVVLIHGVFGYGRAHPAWGYFPAYWPEQQLAALNSNHIIVDVGTASSDHDRACEAFYQLIGGTVDYGEAHAKHTTHDRYGATFETPLHPQWSANNPIHLVGHSLGALTALELYQLLCQDYFRVGSDHRWVRSITSIAGPLTGSTLANMAGLHSTNMPRGSPAHILYIVLGVWAKVYAAVPLLRGAYDLRMDQWAHLSLRALCSVNGPVNQSMDSGFFSILPARRIALNAQLQHMDKLHLLSIVTSPKTCYLPKREAATLALLVLVMYGRRGSPVALLSRWLASRLPFKLLQSMSYVRKSVAFVLVLMLWRQVQQLDVAKLPSLYGLKWLMRRTAKALPALFEGFESHHWMHNDGAVNIRSQLRPWFPSQSLQPPAQELSTATAIDHMDPHTQTLPATLSPPLPLSPLPTAKDDDTDASESLVRCDSHISISDFHHDESAAVAIEAMQAEEREAAAQVAARTRFVQGRWYVYRVNSNHFTGTNWDRDAGNLYKSLFVQIASEYEYERNSNDESSSDYCALKPDENAPAAVGA